VRRELAAQGARRPLVNKAVSIEQALAEIRGKGPVQAASAIASWVTSRREGRSR
jgi:hypothetical protein